jgi:hypothetical protein
MPSFREKRFRSLKSHQDLPYHGPTMHLSMWIYHGSTMQGSTMQGSTTHPWTYHAFISVDLPWIYYACMDIPCIYQRGSTRIYHAFISEEVGVCPSHMHSRMGRPGEHLCSVCCTYVRLPPDVVGRDLMELI